MGYYFLGLNIDIFIVYTITHNTKTFKHNTHNTHTTHNTKNHNQIKITNIKINKIHHHHTSHNTQHKHTLTLTLAHNTQKIQHKKLSTSTSNSNSIINNNFIHYYLNISHLIILIKYIISHLPRKIITITILKTSTFKSST